MIHFYCIYYEKNKKLAAMYANVQYEINNVNDFQCSILNLYTV